MKALAAMLLLAAGCDYVFHLDDVTDLRADARSDGHADAGAFCYGSAFPVCLDAPPHGSIEVFEAGGIDTTTCTGTFMGVLRNNVCVLAAGAITVNQPFRVIGRYPFVLIGIDSLQVNAIIDAGSHLTIDAGVGPAATSADCDTTNLDGAMATAFKGGGGGGAGGSFYGQGGVGGVGFGGTAPGTPVAGITVGQLTGLRGGCRGGSGGPDGSGAFAGGLRGDPGGAIYLISTGTLIVDGQGGVLAGGAAGGGGSTSAGGGGGGAGGLIAFDAHEITINGTVCANGGGGGGGGATGDATMGIDGCPASSITAASGGAANSFGTNGGNGSSLTDPNGKSVTATAMATGAGGGGGGAAGFVLIHAQTEHPGAVTSPLAQNN